MFGDSSSYELEIRREREGIGRMAAESVTEALRALAEDGRAVIVQNLNVTVNYASGGGATVRVEGR